MLATFSVRNLLRSCYLAGLIGTSSGLSYKQLKKKPEKLKSIVKVSAVAGVTGMILGSGFAYLKKQGSFHFIFSSLKGGCSFFLISGCFVGVREALIISDDLPWPVTNEKSLLYQQTALTGTVTGLIIGSFWYNSVFRIISTASGCCAFAAAGQFAMDKFNNWKLRRAIQNNFPELAELQWQLLEEDEKRKIIKDRQGWLSWTFEVLQDRPESAKLQMKIDDLNEQLLSLNQEELTLTEQIGLTGNITREDHHLMQ